MQKIYSVYDSKTEAFMQPFFSLTRGQAIRSFTDAVADSNSMLALHPADFTLFELADWDETTGSIVLPSTPISLGLALDFVNPNSPSNA